MEIFEYMEDKKGDEITISSKGARVLLCNRRNTK